MAKTVAATGCWKIEIVKRSDLHRFVVLPKRWIVERTFARISRNRRLMRDFERYTRTVAAFVRLAMIRIMLRRASHALPPMLLNLIFLDRLLGPKRAIASIRGTGHNLIRSFRRCALSIAREHTNQVAGSTFDG
jgi:hypothetical protein